MNMWPYFSGEVKSSPRTSIYADKTAAIVGDMKLLTGVNEYMCWSGPQSPNGTFNPANCNTTLDCGDTGCLFNITADPGEYFRLEKEMPDVAAALAQQLATWNEGFFNPRRGKNMNAEACAAVWDKYGGFWGPFIFPDGSHDAR